MADQQTVTKQGESVSWRYDPNADDSDSPNPRSGGSSPPPGSSVRWTASEYIEHDRGPLWYLALAIVAIVLAAIIYIATKEWFAAGVTIVVCIIVGVSVRQKPRQIQYELNRDGLKVGEKSFNYNLFKSFSILREEGLNSISLLPLKRLMPPVTAYFEAADEEKIMDVLGEHLPYEEHKVDSIDRLTRRLRL